MFYCLEVSFLINFPDLFTHPFLFRLSFCLSAVVEGFTEEKQGHTQTIRIQNYNYYWYNKRPGWAYRWHITGNVHNNPNTILISKSRSPFQLTSRKETAKAFPFYGPLYRNYIADKNGETKICYAAVLAIILLVLQLLLLQKAYLFI